MSSRNLSERIEASLKSDDACHDLRMLARDFVTEGVSKNELNDAFIHACAEFPANSNQDYPFAKELGETLELLALWTSEYHPEWPAPWYSGQGFEQYKTKQAIVESNAWLLSAIAAAKLGQRTYRVGPKRQTEP